MELSKEEVRAICLGKFTARKCPCCNNEGKEYWDGNTGMGASPHPPPGIAPEDIAWGFCETCDGVAFILTFQE
jgi:hypothetical protein